MYNTYRTLLYTHSYYSRVGKGVFAADLTINLTIESNRVWESKINYA